MTNVVVRAIKMSDEPEILALVREEMTALESIDARFKLRHDAMARYTTYLRERTREVDSAVFVAELDGRVVGLGVASIRPQSTLFEPARTGYISDLLVDPSVRRRGVGSLLHERMTKWFRSLGLDVVRLHVASCNSGAREFWRSRGAREYLIECSMDATAAADRPIERPAGEPSHETTHEPAREPGLSHERADKPAAQPQSVRTGSGSYGDDFTGGI
jgi:GNAT superfamily N-acetyltransferase